MAKKLRKRIVRKTTLEERKRHREVREQIAEELPELKRKGRQAKAAHEALRDAMQALKQEREAQGLSLADIRDRTGIERSTLSRLENDETANPTISTLMRYAEAVGKDILIILTDRPEKHAV
jgi:DNA-binding XRE family transcriptional regulator